MATTALLCAYQPGELNHSLVGLILVDSIERRNDGGKGKEKESMNKGAQNGNFWPHILDLCSRIS